MSKFSAVEKGRINKERYHAYINDLKVTGRKLPLNQFGEVNLSEIAKTCGFNRQVFSTNKNLKKQLEEDIRRIGTEISEGESTESRLEKKAKESTQQVNKLKSDLESKIQEIESLRSTIAELQKHIKHLENKDYEINVAMTELETNGRRFLI